MDPISQREHSNFQITITAASKETPTDRKVTRSQREVRQNDAHLTSTRERGVLKREREPDPKEYRPTKVARTDAIRAPSTKSESKQFAEHFPKPARSQERPKPIEKTQHFLPMLGEIYLKAIESGVKEFEGRINGPACKKMRVGDEIKLFDRKAGWGILCRINSLTVFNSFKSMLETQGVLKMLPQLAQESKYISEPELVARGVKIYQAFPGSSRVASVGVVAIGVTFLKRVYN